MAGRALLLRAEPGFSLPAFERFAPPPPPALIAARIDAASQPGDIVLDLFGRGGWIARAAIDGQRKGISLEGTALDRLLAEIVLRPPDLRHLDAAVQALAASARRESSLKTSITDRFASRCATCERPVTLDEITWSTESEGEDGRPIGPQPTRKHYRCPVCRDQLGGGEQRQAPLDANDLRLALDRDDDGARAFLRDRFPVLEGGESLADELLDLHTPRQLSALAAILERVEGDLRAAPIAAALRLSILHALGPASRLATSPGRVAPLRIAGGHVRLPGGAHWRERNPWLAFEDGVRLVRGFVQRLESGAWGPVPARLGDDLRGLVEGSATAMLKQGTSAALRRAPAGDGATRGDGAPAARPAGPRHAAAPPRRGAARLGLPHDGVGARPRGRRDPAARAAVRARGPPVVGLAGGGRHPGAARRRADHGPQRPGGAAARGRRPGVPGRLRPRRRRRRLPPRGRPAAGGGSRDGRRRRAGPARLGRGPGRRPDPRERRAAAGPGRRRRPGHRARRAPVRAPGADRRRRRSRRRTRPGPWSTPRSTSSSCAASR